MSKLATAWLVLLTFVASVHAYHGGWIAVGGVCMLGAFAISNELLASWRAGR